MIGFQKKKKLKIVIANSGFSCLQIFTASQSLCFACTHTLLLLLLYGVRRARSRNVCQQKRNRVYARGRSRRRYNNNN